MCMNMEKAQCLESLKTAFLLFTQGGVFMTFYLRSFEKAQCKQLKIIAGKYGWLTESFLQTSDWSISFSSPGWRLQKTSCAWHLIHHRTGQKYEMTGPSDVNRGWSWKDDHNMVQHSGPVSHRMQNSTPLCIKHALGMWERHLQTRNGGWVMLGRLFSTWK